MTTTNGTVPPADAAYDPSHDYHALNAMLNLYDAQGRIQFDKDKAAEREYVTGHVAANTIAFPTTRQRLDYLIRNNYYDGAVFDRYSPEFLDRFYAHVESSGFEFGTFLGAFKFYASYALKTFDGTRYLEDFPQRAAAVARLLATVLDGVNAMELGAKLDGVSRYQVIQRDITPELKRKIDDLHLAGVVWCELSSDRIYSTGTQLGALLGGVDDEGNGASGIEQMMNDELTGTDGYEVYQQGNGGEQIPGTMTDSEAAVDGSDVTLTIDQDVNWYVKKVLREGKEEFGAAWAIGVVQDLQTNEIIALEDTDEIEAGSDDAKLNVSQAVSETFEPGSIGKVITMAGLLQAGLHKATDQFTVPYSMTKNGQEFHDPTNHGSEHWTLAGILQNSSNVGMVMAAENYTNEQRYEFLTKFGIGQSTGLDLPGESDGMLAGADAWDGRTRDTVLFGQGYTVNALQLTNVVATIANKGVRHQQSLIKSVTDAQGRVTSEEHGDAVRVIDEQVAADVLNAMESVAEEYDNVAKVDGYRVASKTGTAEVAGADGRLTSIVCDWSGIIPADNPRFVVTVVIKDPQKGGFGGLTAGPLFARIGEFLMQKYEVAPSSPRTDAIPVDW